jgi:serine/threonine-protein kinase
MGTPSYMAPEQAEGRSRDVGERTDVYALGAILYECLTGRPPFKSSSSGETLELVKKRPPAPVRQLRPEVPAELEGVCRKCLEKEPGSRYASAAALAEDLERWLSGRAVTVRWPSWPARVGHALWQRRTRLALLALGLVLVLTGTWALRSSLRVPDGPAVASVEGPETVLRHVHDDLSSGQPVALLGKEGRPLLQRWAVGQVGALDTHGDDGAFTITTNLLALLELLPGPGLERYRLRAEVRHLRSNPGGAVGLYVAYRKAETAAGVAHQFTEVTFNDVFDAGLEYDAVKKLAPELSGPRPKNAVRIAPCVDSGQGWGPGKHLQASGRQTQLFQAAGLLGGEWRTLTVEVSPDAVRAFWGPRNQPAGVLPVREALENLRKAQAQAPRGNPSRALQPEFAVRGGVGLLVQQGAASYRNVVIEPLETHP